jgi:hypothetical protein
LRFSAWLVRPAGGVERQTLATGGRAVGKALHPLIDTPNNF